MGLVVGGAANNPANRILGSIHRVSEPGRPAWQPVPERLIEEVIDPRRPGGRNRAQVNQRLMREGYVDPSRFHRPLATSSVPGCLEQPIEGDHLGCGGNERYL